MENKNKLLIAAAVIIVVIGAVFVFLTGAPGNTPVSTTGNTTGEGLPPVVGITGTSSKGGNSGTNAFTGATSSSGSVLTGSGSSNTGTGTNTPPSSGENPATMVSPISIQAQTASGGTKTFSVTPVQSDSRGDYLLSQYNSYDIVYFPGGSFLISLKDPDVNAARQKAEAHFLSLLKIDSKTACNLTVNETVLYSVDPIAAGVDYKMSFCPGGAAAIPQ